MEAFGLQEVQEALQAIGHAVVADPLELVPGRRGPEAPSFLRRFHANRPARQEAFERSLEGSRVRDNLAAQCVSMDARSLSDETEYAPIERILPQREERLDAGRIHPRDGEVDAASRSPGMQQSVFRKPTHVEPEGRERREEEAGSRPQMDARVGRGGQDELEAARIEQPRRPGTVIRDVQAHGLEAQRPLQPARKARGHRHVGGIVRAST